MSVDPQVLLSKCAEVARDAYVAFDQMPHYWRYPDLGESIQQPYVYFGREWFKQIVEHSASGSRVLQLSTPYQAHEPLIQNHIREFFEGSPFRVVEFYPKAKTAEPSNLSFILTW